MLLPRLAVKRTAQRSVRPARTVMALVMAAVTTATTVTAVAASLLATRVHAQPTAGVLNLYSARHYQTDEALYRRFTEETGIRINRIESGDEALLERLRSEGAHSPADVLLLVDAARLWRAQQAGLFQPFEPDLLKKRIPEHLMARNDGGAIEWYAISTRARVIVYNKDKVSPKLIQTYQDLARPELKGLVCTRSGTHPYMLSLIGALTVHLGEQATQQWAAGVVANFARSPRGGDTDQIKAVASGECGVALTNTYYLARLMRSSQPADQQVAAKVGMVWPNQGSQGTHINVSGAAVLKHAPNRASALRFLEYLASDSAQVHLALGNNEWPAVSGLSTPNPALEAMGRFKPDTLSIGRIGQAQTTAAKIIDRVGWR